jgi:hypothetical protein
MRKKNELSFENQDLELGNQGRGNDAPHCWSGELGWADADAGPLVLARKCKHWSNAGQFFVPGSSPAGMPRMTTRLPVSS